MPDESLILRERRLLRELVALVERRGRTEAELVQKLESGRAAAEQQFADALKRIKAAAEKELASIRGEFEGRISGSRAAFEAELAETRRAMDSQLGKFNERTNKVGKVAKKRLAESLWLIDTVVESGESRISQEYELGKRLLAGRGKALDQMEAGAAELLAASRYRALPAAEAPTVEVEDAKLFAVCDEAKGAAGRALAGLVARVRPRGLSWGMLLVWSLLVGAAATLVGYGVGNVELEQLWKVAAASAGGAFLVLVVVVLLLRRRVPKAAAGLARALADARALIVRCAAKLETDRETRLKDLHERKARDTGEAKGKFEGARTLVNRRNNSLMPRLRDRHASRSSRVRVRMSGALEALEGEYRGAREGSEKRREAALAEATQRRDGRVAQLEADDRAAWAELVREWSEGMARLHAEREALAALGDSQWPDWFDASWAAYKEPARIVPAARFGRLEVDVAEMAGGLPRDPRLAVPGPTRFALPALVDLRGGVGEGSLFIQAGPEGRDAALALLKDVMLRLLTGLPPGKVRFTIVDPVGLGQSFAGFMHLADFEEALVSDRIWTEPKHIDQKLADLTEHMETVIQKYLRNEYENIQQYNADAGEVAEPYRFLVIADFPANITESAAKRLASIVSSGPRCGVYTLIASDAKKHPAHIPTAAIKRESMVLAWKEGRFVYDDEDFGRWGLESEWPPAEDELTRLLTEVGTQAKDSTRVQVPFEMVAPSNGDLWSMDTAEEIRVPLGRAGAKKLQYLSLGRGTTQHALIAGRTGSGKSTLLHVLVTNLALWYSPDEVEFYLVDFKKGVEFKTYASHALPHARVIAVESEREFGLSVLRKLDAELTRRGELFRKAGVQDMAGFRRWAGAETPKGEPSPLTLPRILLIVDEFQEFFVEDDKIAQEASLLMDRLVRQGRAFGMHVVLGSQTLGGAYSIARSTIGQMAVRIALQCSEADSYLIMSEDNAAARLLSRPGEAIYNDASGMLEGNSPFQIVWLPEPTRDAALERVREKLAETGMSAPPAAIVFEGNVPSDLRRCVPLARLVEGRGAVPVVPTAWLGEAISIKEPTSVTFPRHGGSNLLIVGHQEEPAVATLAAVALGLAGWVGGKKTTGGTPVPRFYLLDGVAADSSHAALLPGVFARLPGARAGGSRQAGAFMAELSEELERRMASDSHEAQPVFVFIAGLQRFRDLRRPDDFSFSGDDTGSPGKQFAKLLTEGPPVGMHVIAWCDTATNVDRQLDRTSLREFDGRVVFQMSQNDSTQLIDTPVAATLGRHRAILSRAEQGILEKFRPYSPPEQGWLEGVLGKLGAREEVKR
ncbi:MAG: FtsK/SpoIIIE domain-containing protein [Phycisphaerales bacterium]